MGSGRLIGDIGVSRWTDGSGSRATWSHVAAGLDAVQFAAKIGTSKQSVYHIERGNRVPSLEWLYEAAMALGVRPSDLDPRLTDRKTRRA